MVKLVAPAGAARTNAIRAANTRLNRSMTLSPSQRRLEPVER
jgi:hypothetical protein